MPRSERLKAEIAFHEKMFFAAMASMFALIGWLATTFDSAPIWMQVLATAGVFIAVGFGFWNYRSIKQLLEELDDA